MPRSAASLVPAASSADFPIPGSPLTMTTLPRPAATVSSCLRKAWISVSRPRRRKAMRRPQVQMSKPLTRLRPSRDAL
jgi:hypothetical protein